jgi:hypothetical protein
MQVQVNAALFRPLRLNFAQVCIWCCERWCESADCVAKHERSTWAVCETCEGGAIDDGGVVCYCAYGVVEVSPKYAAKRAELYRRTAPETVRASSEARVLVVAR